MTNKILGFLAALVLVLAGSPAFAQTVAHSTTFIHGGHTCVVEGDASGGFMCEPDKTAFDRMGKVGRGKVDVVAPANQASTTGLAQTIDGVALSSAGMRVLLPSQTTVTQDGCYVVASGAWTRCPEFPTGLDAQGSFFVAAQGTANKGLWIETHTAAAVVGTADLTFSNVAGGGGGGSVTFSAVQTALAGASSAVAFNAQRLTGVADPTASQDAVTAAFLSTRLIPVSAVSTAPLASYTYANVSSGVGATITLNTNAACPTFDGVALTANLVGSDLVLFLNGASQSDNGIYRETQNGDGSTIPCVLTRSTAADTSPKILGSKVRVKSGIQFAGSEWEYNNTGAITLGTTAVTWTPTVLLNPNSVYDYTEEFCSALAGVTTTGTLMPNAWQFQGSGTPAAWSGVPTLTRTELCGGQLTTGTSPTGNAEVNYGTHQFLLNQADEWLFSFRFNVPTLSDGTNTFKAQVGLSTTASVAGTDGLWIESDQTSATALRCTARIGSASTIGTGGPTTVAGQWYRGDVYHQAGDALVHMYIDNVACDGGGFTSGQVPYGVGLTPYAAITKSLGATARLLGIDYYRQRYVWPARRAP